MLGVITGFTIILAVIFTGWMLARTKVIRSNSERLMFNRVAFYAATPALLFDAVSTSDPENFLTPVTLVISLATILVSVVYAIFFFRQGAAGVGIGAASASYFNSVNIGLPVSIYVIGDATHVVPIMLLQMMVFTPVILGMLGGGSFWGAVKTGLLNPVVLASIAGFVVAVMGWEVPAPVAEPIALLGGASIPMVLMSFGASISGAGVLSDAKSRPAVLTATALKLVGMPLAGFAMANLLGLEADLVYACTILCALPTAQNVYNFAATFERGQTIARDTVFITTFASLPVMLLLALLFGR